MSGQATPSGRKPIRVLITDDSATVRKVLTRELSKDPDIEVVGAAPDPYVARDMIVRLEPDVLTLDVEMPRMDGISFLKRLMALRPMPVIVVSSLTPEGGAVAMEALSSGAVDVVCKPSAAYSIGEATTALREKIKLAATVKVAALRPRVAVTPAAAPTGAMTLTTNKIVAIGTSTGGTEALRRVLPALPKTCPGVLVVQHMPERFTKSFAEGLNRDCEMEVKEAEEGDSVIPGRVLIAPGGAHLLLSRCGARYVAKLSDAPPVSRHRPSADVLFRSVAEVAGRNAIGVIMTGMGSDGAAGLLEMRNRGCPTIGQDEASCVVYGMPKQAFELGAVESVQTLDDIAPAILERLSAIGHPA